MVKKKSKTHIYEASPQFGTKYYGAPSKDIPKNWYKVRAKNKEEAISMFAKRYHNTKAFTRKYARIRRMD